MLPTGDDAMADYERLSAMDASFLGIEDGTCHMHVGAVMLFDAAPLRTSAGGVDIDRIRRAVHARLHLVPRFRQRVAYVPYEGVPIWIDDDRFRLAYHVRHTALPRPGDDRVLSGSSAASCRSRSTARVRSGRCGSSKGWTGTASPSSARRITAWSTACRAPI